MPPEGFLDNGNIQLRFCKTSRDTNGELLEMEAIYRPTSSPPPAHFHPKQEETFTVVSGSLGFRRRGAGTDRFLRQSALLFRLALFTPRGILDLKRLGLSGRSGRR